MISILINILGVTLLLCAFYPELHNYYRRSKLIASHPVFDAETARKLTDMSIEYSSRKRCVICGLLLKKKTVYITAAVVVFLLTCIFTVVIYPKEMPDLLTIALDSYMWVVGFSVVLRYCFHRFHLPLGLSLTVATIMPVCFYCLIFFICEIISPLNINDLYEVIH